MSSYHNINFCEMTRGIDKLIEKYAADRDHVTNLMITDQERLIKSIWDSEGALGYDNECQCNMGSGNRTSPFTCAQCNNLRKLFDFRMGGVSTPFEIQCGNLSGQRLVVLEKELARPYLEWDNETASKARIYVNQYSKLLQCGTPDVSNLKCIRGDEFTIRTIIMWILYKLFSESGLPHIPLLYTSFICKGKGYSVFEFPDIGPLSELYMIDDFVTKSEDIRSNSHSNDEVVKIEINGQLDRKLKPEILKCIIDQLIVIYLELSKIYYVHGNPNRNALIFTSEPVSYMYNGYHVKGPLTVKITDMWKSSVNINSVQYYAKDITVETNLEKSTFIPEIATRTVSSAFCKGNESAAICPVNMNNKCSDKLNTLCSQKNIVMYRLTNSTATIYTALNHIGFPLYVGSFDFYCFMVSLMCDKSIFDVVKNDEDMNSLWMMMWTYEDLINIEESIKYYPESKPVDIIKGSWLRCDILDVMWSMISSRT